MDSDERLETIRQTEIERNIPLVICVALMVVLGLVGNAFSVVFYGFKRKRTVTNFLIAALATNDLLANIVFCDELAVIFHSFNYRNKTGCRVIFFFNNFVMLNSVTLLAIISVERYRRICHPFSRQLILRAAACIVVGFTILTMCLTSREIFLADIVTKPILMNDNSTIYGYFCSHTMNKSFKGYIKTSHLVNIALFVSVLVVIIVSYCLVMRRIVKSRRALRVNSFRQSPSTSVSSSLSGKDSSKTVLTTKASNVNVSVERCESNMIEKSEIRNVNEENIRIEDQYNNRVSENDEAHTKNENGHGCSNSNNNAFKDHINDTTDNYVEVDNGTEASDELRDKLDIRPSDSTSSSAQNSDSFRSEIIRRNTVAEHKVTKMIIVFTIISLLSFVPYFGVMLFTGRHRSTENNLSNMWKKVARQFYMLNCVVNPYIMCCFDLKFRKFISNVVCKRQCTEKQKYPNV